MFVIKYKKFFIGLSIFFVVAALASIITFGLNFGIDFKGGSALTYTYPSTTLSKEGVALLAKKDVITAGFKEAQIQVSGDSSFIVKTNTLTDAQRASIVNALTVDFKGSQESFTAIGPSVGAELTNKAIISITLVLVAIILFVAYAFRGVSKPVSSWKYGLAVIIALFHDIIIPTGVMALFGHFIGAEVDTLFVVALLTTLGLSVSDTIVVFDRIREHLQHDVAVRNGTRPFADLVGESLGETFARSINTSFVVLVMVISLAVFGPTSTKLFSTILAVGMFFGTYSSIFLASPLLVLFNKTEDKKTKK